MKRFGLICLLLIGASYVKAQDNARRDSLLSRLYNFKMPNQNQLFKPLPYDSLLGKTQTLKYLVPDSLKKSGYGVTIKGGVYHSSTDHMPIAVLPSNSRMPVYGLHSNDKMPGSNLPKLVSPVVPVTPQK